MAILKEGSNTYERVGDKVLKNGVEVPAKNLKYVPSSIGGTRDDTQSKALTTAERTKSLQDSARAAGAGEVNITSGYADLLNRGGDIRVDRGNVSFDEPGYAPIPVTSPNQSAPIRSAIPSPAPSVAGGVNPATPSEIGEQTLGQIQRQRSINSLQAQLDKTLGALTGQKDEIAPVYREQVGRARTESTQGERKFADFLAERGLQSSGLAGAGEIQRTAGLQNQIGGIREQEAGAFADIARQRADAETTFNAGVRDADFAAEDFDLQQQLTTQATADARALQLENAQIEAAIKEAQAVNDFERELELTEIKRANNESLAWINKSGGSATPEVVDTSRFSPTEMTSYLYRTISQILPVDVFKARKYLGDVEEELQLQYGPDRAENIMQEMREAINNYINEN